MPVESRIWIWKSPSMRILFANDAAPGNGNPPPPAAAVVLAGTKTEAEIKLETDLADERNRHGRTAEDKKQREIKISELEDELAKLRRIQSATPPVPPVPPRKKGILEAWMDGED
jgi:hypothetical protein